MPSIERIEQTQAKLETIWGGGYPPAQFNQMHIDFRVFYRGLNHVAGIIYTTDGWITRKEQLAKWLSFTGSNSEIELWNVVMGHHKSINRVEYVIFCEDYRNHDDIKKIYKTNNGEPFIVTL